MPREHAPLGRTLPYRRASGQGPSRCTALGENIARRGWLVDLGDRGLGDLLLGLAVVRALLDASSLSRGNTPTEAIYRGSRSRLLERWLPLSLASEHADRHIVTTASPRPVRFVAEPEAPPTWLDVLEGGEVEVHASLPMRYYLDIEQAIGMRLPAESAPAPTFSTNVRAASPYHVVFVTTTSWQARKNYGAAGFAQIAAALVRRRSAPWRFTIISPAEGPPAPWPEFLDLPHEVLPGLDAADCLEVFGSAEAVIGNDTGLTHLAALTTRPDGTGPHVVGLYGRHAFTKWITGCDRHHAVATPLSQMMGLADACPVRDRIDDQTWGAAADIRALPPEGIALFAGRCMGWW